MTDIDKVAEALYIHLNGTEVHSWDRISEVRQSHYRRMAQAAIDALQLTEEWTRTIGDVFPCGIFDTKQRAEARNAELDLMHGSQGAARGIASRLVSPWVRVEKP